jgi:hypothetical protein
MITCACPQCGKDFTVKDEWAGKRVKCRNCGTGFAIPPAQAGEGGQAPVVVARYKADPDDVWEELLDHLSGLPAYEIVSKKKRSGILTFRDTRTGLLITAVTSEDKVGCALAFAFDESRFNPDDIPEAAARLGKNFKASSREEAYKRYLEFLILFTLDKEFSRAGAGCLGMVLFVLGGLFWLAAEFWN